ncbi:MAG: twin-arginine translocation signal domain-containing protein [Candidatus Aminicenantes bacterium]|nr:twin-arginine translocation signal domain-containing protein [Candidatus Aminicenantes bacterium]
MTTRRDFLKTALIAGAAWPRFQEWGQGGRGRMRAPIDASQIPPYRTKIIPMDRWTALKADFEKVRQGDGLSRHKLFRASLEALDFGLPADFKDARSVVVAATFAKSATADFRHNGQSHRILVPFQYYEDEWTPEKLKSVIQADLLKEPGRKLSDISKRVPLKYLAGRSGLGRFGRNNLIFVDGMGSYNLLHAFVTDAKPAADPDVELEILDECRHCHMCDRICPTSCLSRTNFIVDAGRCLTLFNENSGDFPNIFLPSMHHVLMGCLKCQSACPENSRIPELTATLEGVSEEETKAILKGTPSEALKQSLKKRLRLFPAVKPADFGPILKRNLGALIRA